MYALYGDIMREKREYKRSIALYVKCLQLMRGEKEQQQSGRSLITPEVRNESDLLHEIAKCYVWLGETKSAFEALKRIDDRERSVPASVLLGKTAKSLGNTKVAIQAFQDAVRRSPYCIEAIIGLCTCGVSIDRSDIERYVHSDEDASLLFSIAEGHAESSAVHSSTKAVNILSKLQG
eukprot:TRINITY_DN15227_c0_g1::TRINITY_DN15227_c0_g1_i1::g.30796::m.30796 TRINITY_DN15227_c0_g1::TRINITY_DN15227_c0_g1_i1::g.30796  ORF type:complete len:207 (-),score=-9.24,sp/Q8VY89/APC7_ARATH/29.55/7e-13,Apc3/PF12895.2/6.3,Apc3/PF12895.2/5.3e-06,TPR_8/PF13181.1/0.31,TPR_8/PF13181.1/42,TPR_8/PF13181.1/0.5,TPR_2/PF07719.12/4.3e+03,TPR_2/PF07719.12/0.74,TPR_2/PF07719.12/31,TPR_2/PF07719.12/0.44,TPR_12/PF13424.1/0.0016,TPR_12/PF13424.1/0.02,TPR_14/PF13428.1/1.3e+02,TPR_14/PF13428.1/34,TPR_14/PF13428.1/0.